QTLMALGPVRLIIDEAGHAAIAIGDEVLSFGERLRPRWWHHIEGLYDPATGLASIVSDPFVSAVIPQPADMKMTIPHGKKLRTGVTATGPLIFAAEQVAPGRTTQHFEGKLEAPTLWSGVTKERSPEWTLKVHWDFARGIGTRRIDDISPHGLH